MADKRFPRERTDMHRPRGVAAMMRPVLLALLAITAAAVTLSADTSVAWEQNDSTRVIAYNGFSGWWDRYGLAHPSFHHRVECEPQYSGFYTTKQPCYYGPGDWSVDFYNSSGTLVRHNGLAQGGSLTARVWAIQPTCSAGPSAGGYTVFIDLYVNGQWQGWASHGHLNSVQVSAGQWISPGQALGYLNLWPYSAGCWEVTSNSGVHTHYEEYNAYRYACYQNYSSGTWLSYPGSLGIVGRTVYTAPRSPC